jgi:hypothetical protein
VLLIIIGVVVYIGIVGLAISLAVASGNADRSLGYK